MDRPVASSVKMIAFYELHTESSDSIVILESQASEVGTVSVSTNPVSTAGVHVRDVSVST